MAVEKEWIYKDFKCVVIATGMGHRCGYVAVSENHPFYGLDYEDEKLHGIDVHGGLTYSKGKSDYPVESEGLWWFGFDCAHSGDGRDFTIMSEDYRRAFEKMEYFGGEVRTSGYVSLECERLVDQLLEMNKEG